MDIISYNNIERLMHDSTGYTPETVGIDEAEVPVAVFFKKKDIKLPNMEGNIMVEGYATFDFHVKILEYLDNKTFQDFLSRRSNVAKKMGIIRYDFRYFRSIQLTLSDSKGKSRIYSGNLEYTNYKFIQALAIKDAKERIRNKYIKDWDKPTNETFQEFYISKM